MYGIKKKMPATGTSILKGCSLEQFRCSDLFGIIVFFPVLPSSLFVLFFSLLMPASFKIRSIVLAEILIDSDANRFSISIVECPFFL